MDRKQDWTDCKSRKILTLEERVQAIREYDRIPIYQKVGDIMNCCAKQIKNIVQNRESILLYYASRTGDCQGGFTRYAGRQQKIDLLNKVIFEWIQRTQSREDVGRISPRLIRTIALDVKNHVKIASFYPNKIWLKSFMQQYDLTEDDLINQKVYSRSVEPKQHLSLKISDIVDYVKDLRENPQPETYQHSSADDDDEKEDFGIPAKVRRIDKTDKSDSEQGITTYEEALRHLKPLEEFVLLQENFRAIGLISQLEAIFRNPDQF